MKRVLLLIFSISLIASAQGQNLQEYNYIKVPVQFEFLKEENQYQLNALTAFLFEKKGFEVLYRDNITKGIDPCDVLQANVYSDSGLFRTRLYFTLQNCKNEIVFTSAIGVSREKDFKNSYHEALRSAFDSLERSAVKKLNTEAEDVVEPASEETEEVIIDPVVTAKEIDSFEAEEKSFGEASGINYASEEKIFTNGPLRYILKNTSAGFDLYKEGSDEIFAKLLKSKSGNNYLYASGNISGNAFFDTSGNLIVEYLDPESQQLVSVIYKLQSQ
ncbi:hypothetical protein [Salinimicrobium xinjiangense]|uniref:hypothetical protein n=1 Tax=Salinimicrobium xinjiangense TaxID=438596 RepID=UPI000422DA35|nr:hypothetical protein [Salinimicrobium xinjiangense]